MSSHRSPGRVAILFNPVSGSGRARVRAQAIGEAIRGSGRVIVEVESRADPACAWLPGQLADCDALIVVGGDGAVRLAAPTAAALDLPIYHARAGTENLFARAHRMEGSPAAVVAALEARRVRRVDLGDLDGEAFVLMASVGFDAAVVRGVALARGASISHLTYAPVILRQLGAWRAESIEVALDGGASRSLGRGMFVVANAPDYALRMDPVRDADPSDGLLDAAFLPCAGSPGAILWFLRCLASRTHVAGAVRLRARRFDIGLSGDPPWQADGDSLSPRGRGRRLAATVRPGALPVLLPAS